MTRVYVSAGSSIIRTGLETVVRSSSSFDLAGAAPLDQFEEQLEAKAADILLLSIPQLDEEWIARLADVIIPVVLLTEQAEPALLSAALRASVNGVLSSDASSAELEAALCSAAAGLITLQQSTLELLIADSRPAPAALLEPLSPRELEVLAMLTEGLSNKLIAHRLGISEHTVKFHVTSIMAKLGAGSRTDAVMQGIRHGLVML